MNLCCNAIHFMNTFLMKYLISKWFFKFPTHASTEHKNTYSVCHCTGCFYFNVDQNANNPSNEDIRCFHMMQKRDILLIPMCVT